MQKNFRILGGHLEGVATIEWDDAGQEVICDEIELETKGDGIILRRGQEGLHGHLFEAIENYLLHEEGYADPDVDRFYARAAKREFGGNVRTGRYAT